MNRPGCYEAPLGITCRELIEEYAGGVWKDRRAKALIPGGFDAEAAHRVLAALQERQLMFADPTLVDEEKEKEEKAD